ncbi:lamin tail domain-containing protein [Streptomyces pathocidini]|uniref:Lamin tail domain-containing protein n=1 Tax=Streptomyces pathocidini TaxID=1650571 RepID=A0ABW7UPW1_9ACTN
MEPHLNRTRTCAAAAIAAGCAAVLLLPVQAQAAGSVYLSKVYYDSPGSDTGGNASLNGEYVQIKNSTSRGVNLKGWTLTDAQKHKYTFGTYTLGAGKTVTVKTGKGTNTSSTRYQGRTWYVWNNTSDKATLRKPAGTTVDTCSYNSSRYDYKTC